MAVQSTNRPRAVQTARELERLGSVISADRIAPTDGLQGSWSLEVTLADVCVPPSVLDVLARRDSALSDVSIQGDHCKATVLL